MSRKYHILTALFVVIGFALFITGMVFFCLSSQKYGSSNTMTNPTFWILLATFIVPMIFNGVAYCIWNSQYKMPIKKVKNEEKNQAK